MHYFWFVLAFLLISCHQHRQARRAFKYNAPGPVVAARLDTSLYAILPLDSFARLVMDLQGIGAKPIALTAADIDDLEGLIDSACFEYDRSNPGYQLMSPLSRYYRQYVAFLDHDGEKHIWVNCLCSNSGMDWRHAIIITDDGGTCYFQMFINWSRRRVVHLSTNGVASAFSDNGTLAIRW